MAAEGKLEKSCGRRKARLLLRACRERVALSQSEVEQRLGWPPSKLSKIEAGAIYLSSNNANKLLRL
jgi:hypothetical protein